MHTAPNGRTQMRYCTYLSKNVILQCPRALEEGYFCLNREDCGFSANGCRNKLAGMWSGERCETRGRVGIQ